MVEVHCNDGRDEPISLRVQKFMCRTEDMEDNNAGSIGNSWSYSPKNQGTASTDAATKEIDQQHLPQQPVNSYNVDGMEPDVSSSRAPYLDPPSTKRMYVGANQTSYYEDNSATNYETPRHGDETSTAPSSYHTGYRNAYSNSPHQEDQPIGHDYTNSHPNREYYASNRGSFPDPEGSSATQTNTPYPTHSANSSDFSPSYPTNHHSQEMQSEGGSGESSAMMMMNNPWAQGHPQPYPQQQLYHYPSSYATHPDYGRHDQYQHQRNYAPESRASANMAPPDQYSNNPHHHAPSGGYHPFSYYQAPHGYAPHHPFQPPMYPQHGGAGMMMPMDPDAAASLQAQNDTRKTAPKKKAKSKKFQKKQAGKPKRPLSAYNCFFQDERARMLNEMENTGTEAAEIASSTEDTSVEGADSKSVANSASKESTAIGSSEGDAAVNDDQSSGATNKKKGIGFAEMARTISVRWKSIDGPTLEKYKEKAALDMQRYRKEMEVFNSKSVRGETDPPTGTMEAKSNDTNIEEEDDKGPKGS